MGIIGKVYANSMLVLINSRMVFGSEETPSTIISRMRFAASPANDTDTAIETYKGDLTVDSTELRTGHLSSSEP